MKKYLIFFILILCGLIAYLSYKNKRLTTKYEASIENIKAYDSLLSGLNNDNRVFKLTIELLHYFNDSIIHKLNKVKEELGIKDKRLLLLLYLLSQSSRSDTIIVADTIFRDRYFRLDTIVGDKWFKTNLSLSYPGTIIVTPEIILERYVFISGKKETVSPPKKFFLTRWFLKRHIIAEVQIKEMNPYVKNKDQRFIQIIK